ncbi:MAG: tetratricopeptide repeat protein [Candidatus Eremiobacterota bacterium]
MISKNTVFVSLMILFLMAVFLPVYSQSSSEWNNKGIKLYEEKKYEEAIKCFDKALNADPGSPQLWLNKGNCYLQTGEENKAITCYNKSLEYDSENSKAMYFKGVALYLLYFPNHNYDPGLKTKGYKSIEKALKLNPELVNKKIFIMHLKNISPALLHFAVAHGESELTELLLTYGADTNIFAQQSSMNLGTPLQILAGKQCVLNEEDMNKNIHLVELLIKSGAKINTLYGIDNCKTSPFHILAMIAIEPKEKFDLTLKYRELFIKKLLYYKGNINIKDTEGNTPLDLAKSPEIKDLFIKYGAKSSKNL